VTLLDPLRWAVAADQRRSMSIMSGGVAVFVALGGLAMLLEVPRFVSGLMAIMMLAAWVVAGCGVVGYFRWFFRAEVDEQRRR
jgi:flagellar basal body-associated protein FliL